MKNNVPYDRIGLSMLTSDAIRKRVSCRKLGEVVFSIDSESR